jgi:hypothetical protein
MFKHLISATPAKKWRCVKKKKDVDGFTTGNIRQIIYRRHSKGTIHAVVFLNYNIILMLSLLLDLCTMCLWVALPTFWRCMLPPCGNTAHIHKLQNSRTE